MSIKTGWRNLQQIVNFDYLKRINLDGGRSFLYLSLHSLAIIFITSKINKDNFKKVK